MPLAREYMQQRSLERDARAMSNIHTLASISKGAAAAGSRSGQKKSTMKDTQIGSTGQPRRGRPQVDRVCELSTGVS